MGMRGGDLGVFLVEEGCSCWLLGVFTVLSPVLAGVWLNSSATAASLSHIPVGPLSHLVSLMLWFHFQICGGTCSIREMPFGMWIRVLV